MKNKSRERTKKLKGWDTPPLLNFLPWSHENTQKKGWGTPSPYLLFTHESFRAKKNRDYKKIEISGAFHLIMDPTVNKRKLKREEEEEES